MAIRPAYGQFPRRSLPVISKGQNTANEALVQLRERQEKTESPSVPVIKSQSVEATPTAVAPLPTTPSESATPK